MAKVKLDYMSLSMRAEGSDDMVRELSGRFLDMADKYAAPGFYFPALPPSVFEDGCRDPEELNTGAMKPLTTSCSVAATSRTRRSSSAARYTTKSIFPCTPM